MIPGAEVLIKCLEKEDVEVIFGYPGGASLDIFDAIAKSKKIRLVLVRNEQGAAHAASGYARATGKVGVCTATSGPGATNLITGIATAYMDSIPILCITGQVATGMVGTDAFQEVDTTGITDPITKHNYLVKDAAELPRIIKESFYIAQSGRPGPILIDLPKNISAQKVNFKEYKQVELRGYKPNVTGHARQIKQVIAMLKEAKRPLICAGGGVISANACNEMIELAEAINAPVVNTLMGVGSIPMTHPLALGMLGTYGVAEANLAVYKCDLLMALGMRFDDRVTNSVAEFAPQAKIIHIDIDAAEIGKNQRADVPIVGDLKIVLGQLKPSLPRKDNHQWLQEITEIKAKAQQCTLKACEHTYPISAADVMNELNKCLPEQSIITTDVGQHQIWAAQKLQVRQPRNFISSGGLGTMGYGIPAAVGAQIACPQHTVVVVTGDGSMQMGMPELGTALEQGLPLKILLLNNQTLGMVKQLQYHYCEGRYAGVFFGKNPEFQYIAKAYGAMYQRVEQCEELAAKMLDFIKHPGMAILEVIVPCAENTFPVVLAGQSIDQMNGIEEGES